MVAWAFHRISGLAILAFVLLHVFDIYLAGADPKVYDDLLSFYASTPGRIMEVLLGAALLYHSLNGIRILLMDFWPRLTVYHKQLWYANWSIFLAVGLPGAFIIMRPALGL
jgi:succinate dehydrogenase / fumarate reductase cytochrome b subunit